MLDFNFQGIIQESAKQSDELQWAINKLQAALLKEKQLWHHVWGYFFF